MTIKNLILTVAVVCFSTTAILAQTSEKPTESNRIFNWQMSNMQLLYGYNYVWSPNKANQEVITLEHANGWKYGDNFFFMDISSLSSYPKAEIYFEVAPRLSLGKLTGKKVANGIIKDVLLAGQWNYGYNFDTEFSPNILLYGIGVDLQLPYFNFVQLNVYARNNLDTDKTSWQLTTAWLLPIEYRAVKIEFGGFLDLAGGDDDGLKTNLLVSPQLLLDMGNFVGKSGKLMLGTEYSYWKNKFGNMDGVNENVWNIMAKYYF